MTETEWRTSTTPSSMVDFLGAEASARKLRLFACGCCRSEWSNLGPLKSSRAVEIAERFADGGSSQEEMLRAAKAAEAAANRAMAAGRERPDSYLHSAARAAAYAQAYDAALTAEARIRMAYQPADEPSYRVGNESPAFAQLLRDIFNPFRPVAFDPSWRTTTVLALGQQMYDSRDFMPMPILADALQDAGCEDGDILAHCRGEGPHVRGCWVVDLVLGKE